MNEPMGADRMKLARLMLSRLVPTATLLSMSSAALPAAR